MTLSLAAMWQGGGQAAAEAGQFEPFLPGLVVLLMRIKGLGKILIVDDEWESPIVKAVQYRLETEGWHAMTIVPESQWRLGEEFEEAVPPG